MYPMKHHSQQDQSFVLGNQANFDDDDIMAFRERQKRDLDRWQHDGQLRQRRKMPPRENDESYESDGEESRLASDPLRLVNRTWRNAEDETLADYGVDEEIDIDDEIPLSELISRR